MPQRQLTEAEAALLAIPDPLERAARITEYGRPRGTLHPLLSEQRKADLRASRQTHSASKIAAVVRLARSGIFRLTAEEAS